MKRGGNEGDAHLDVQGSALFRVKNFPVKL